MQTTNKIPREKYYDTQYMNVDLGTWIKNLRTTKRLGRKSYLTNERITLMDQLEIEC